MRLFVTKLRQTERILAVIREIELENVRIFGERAYSFSLPELTVFCGTNSSGKSTILKSILLLRQSIDGLHFAGPEVDLGDYSSFVSHRNPHRDVSVAITFDDKLEPGEYSLMLSAPKDKDDSKKVAKDKLQANIPCLVKVSFTLCPAPKPGPDQETLFGFANETRGLSGIKHQGILKSITYETIVNEKELFPWKVRLARELANEKGSYDYEILMPKRYFEKVGGTRLMKVEKANGEHFVKANASIKGIMPNGIFAEKMETADSAEEKRAPRLYLFPLPPYFDDVLANLRSSLRNTEYLGPFRTPAKRYYITNFDAIPDLDPEGRFLPYILRNMEERMVLNVRPGEKKQVSETLSDALNGWLYYLRTGNPPIERTESEIKVSTLKGAIVEFEIKSVSGIGNHALADSGFGYSQVIPILVRGLLASEGSTFIVEQPELHLNPALHVRLANFFVSMVRAGKQMIIETHSEHIVNAIRVFAAEDEEGKLASKCAIHYIDAEDDTITVHDLFIEPDSTVPKWPFHFFGEAASLAGRMLRAQKHTRNRVRHK